MSTDRAHQRPSLGIVIPVYNEELVLGDLFKELNSTFSEASCSAHGLSSVEYLFVDDGSLDASAEIITGEIRAGANARLIRFSRNFGHQASVSAGLFASDADLCAVIDADLQDPPEVILELLSAWRKGYDVVYAVRRKRKEFFVKRLLYWLFYRIIALMSDVEIPKDAGDFCLMDRRVVDAMNQLPEHLRIPRILRAWVGFRQTGVEYERPARAKGDSKYQWKDLYRLATDGLAAASTRPLQFAQLASFLFFILTCALFSWHVISGLLSSDFSYFADPNWLLLLTVCFSNAVVLLSLHIHGAYLGRAYLEAKGRPSYVVLETIAEDSFAQEESRHVG